MKVALPEQISLTPTDIISPVHNYNQKLSNPRANSAKAHPVWLLCLVASSYSHSKSTAVDMLPLPDAHLQQQIRNVYLPINYRMN